MGKKSPNLEILTPGYQGVQSIHLDDKFRFRLPRALGGVFLAAQDRESYCMTLDVFNNRIALLPRRRLSEIFGDAALRKISPFIVPYQPDNFQRHIVPKHDRIVLGINNEPLIIAGHHDYMALYTSAGWDQYLQTIKCG